MVSQRQPTRSLSLGQSQNAGWVTVNITVMVRPELRLHVIMTPPEDSIPQVPLKFRF